MHLKWHWKHTCWTAMINLQKRILQRCGECTTSSLSVLLWPDAIIITTIRSASSNSSSSSSISIHSSTIGIRITASDTTR